MKKKKLNNKLVNISKSWSFNKSVSNNFDTHVVQSIPFYKEIIKMIAGMSEFFLKENSIIYDLGCSTGNVILSLCKLGITHPINIYGVDREKQMLKIAKKKVKNINLKKNTKVVFIQKDILKIDLIQNNLTICSLLFPFLKKKDQISLLKKIYASLEPGGGVIILDKIKSDSVDFENMFNQIYFDFKKSKRINHIDIIKKSKSLRSVHSLKTQKETLDMLKKIGFKNIENFFKFTNFSAYIGIK